MGENIQSPLVPSPPVQHSLPMVYYGLIVVGVALTVSALYNFIIVKWCSSRELRPLPRMDRLFQSRNMEPPSSMSRQLGVSSFKYKKEGGAEGGDCVVCLSAFEDGEDVWQLSRCGHHFHAPCIDMWLCSHSDCPLCRATVVEIRREDHEEGFIASGNFV